MDPESRSGTIAQDRDSEPRRWRASSMFAQWVAGSSFSALLVVDMNLQQQAAVLRLEWAVEGPRRPAGIGIWRKARASISGRIVADDQVTGNQVDLLPVVVDERSGGKNSGSKT